MIIKFKHAGSGKTTTVVVPDSKKDDGLKDKVCDLANAESSRLIKESEFSHKVEKLEEKKVISDESAKPEKPKKRKRSSRCKDRKDEKKKTKKPKIEIPKIKVPRPGLPVNLLERIGEMGGSVPQLLIQKSITKTDTEGHNARLSIPWGQIEDQVAFKKEPEIMKNEDFKVILIDPNMEEYTLGFNKWGMSSSFTYNLISSKTWPLVRENNGITKGHCVQVWWFRRKFRLCLLLVNLSKENSADVGDLHEVIVDNSTKEEEEREEDTSFVAVAGLVKPRKHPRKSTPHRSPFF